MAAITITPANVVSQGTNARGTAGGTITAGMALIVDTDGDLIAGNNDDDAAAAAVIGIALHGASNGQPLEYLKFGNITIGGTVAVGKVYVLGTSGGIIPVDDIASTEFITVIGVGISATVIKCAFIASGVAAADAVA